jgi:signal transduction histidine kinase
MNDLRRALNQIGGPYSITWTSFWVTYALNLLTHFTGNPGIGAPIITRFAIVSLSQLAIWAVLLTGKAILLRNTAVQPRPFTTLALFAIAGIARGIVIGVCLSAAGGDASPQLAYRGLAGLFTISTVLTVTALTVNAAREHAERLRNLMASNVALEEARAHMTVGIEARNEAAVARIQRELLQEFEAIDPDCPAEAVSLLERTASEMVRPLSHELASSIPAWSPTPTDRLSPRINWPVVFDLASRGRPLSPLATAVSLAVMSFVFAFVFFRPAEVLLLMLDALVATWVLLTLGNALLARTLPYRAVWVRVLAVTFTGLIAGAVTGYIAHEIADGSVAGQWTWFGAIVVTCAIGWLLAIARAVNGQHRTDEELLASREVSLRWQVARVGQVQWHQQKALSRALHGPIQGAVTAAAMRLDDAVRAGTDATALVAETRDELRAAVSLLEEKPDSTPGMLSTLDLFIGTWQGVCRVVAVTTPDATAALDNDELSRSCLRDVLTDAISNAVRHGDASIVDISISLVGDEVLVRVRDNGAAPGSAAIPGLGTRLLEECSTRWSSEATDDGYLLTASLPVMP